MPSSNNPQRVGVHDPIGQLIRWNPTVLAEKLTLRSVAAVLAADDIGAALVEHDGRTGIVSERDVVRALADDADPDVIWSADVMTEDLITASSDEPIMDVARRMLDAKIRHIAVVDEGEITGIISARDVFEVLAEDAREWQ